MVTFDVVGACLQWGSSLSWVTAILLEFIVSFVQLNKNEIKPVWLSLCYDTVVRLVLVTCNLTPV